MFNTLKWNYFQLWNYRPIM